MERCIAEELKNIYSFFRAFSHVFLCKDSANERNASLLAGYKVSAAYFRSIYTAKIVLLCIKMAYWNIFLAFLRKKTSKIFFFEKKVLPLHRK